MDKADLDGTVPTEATQTPHNKETKPQQDFGYRRAIRAVRRSCHTVGIARRLFRPSRVSSLGAAPVVELTGDWTNEAELLETRAEQLLPPPAEPTVDEEGNEVPPPAVDPEVQKEADELLEKAKAIRARVAAVEVVAGAAVAAVTLGALEAAVGSEAIRRYTRLGRR